MNINLNFEVNFYPLGKIEEKLENILLRCLVVNKTVEDLLYQIILIDKRIESIISN